MEYNIEELEGKLKAYYDPKSGFTKPASEILEELGLTDKELGLYLLHQTKKCKWVVNKQFQAYIQKWNKEHPENSIIQVLEALFIPEIRKFVISS
ncbi:MAG: hypothetical protein ACFFBD_30275, partial [Candidatus Hodarchaeota archaeon]